MYKIAFIEIKDVASNIKKFREMKSLTREHLAAALDISVSGYCKIERGEIDLTVSKLQKIADVLDVSASEILNFDATTIFNITNNKEVQNIGNKENHNTNNSNSVDDYTKRYILMLEN